MKIKLRDNHDIFFTAIIWIVPLIITIVGSIVKPDNPAILLYYTIVLPILFVLWFVVNFKIVRNEN